MYRTLATLLALVAFVQAIESVSADNEFDEFVELYNSVFGPNSEPLEPEEARKAIQRIRDGRDVYKGYDFYDQFLVNGLKNAELRLEECNFENGPKVGNWNSKLGISRFLILRRPALQPYLKSLRARMVQCFRDSMGGAVVYYSSMTKADNSGAYAYFKESLASMPLEFFTEQNFIKTKDERISKVLAGVVKRKYGVECGDSKPTCFQMIKSKLTSFTKMFQDSVVEFCKKVSGVKLVPESIQSIAYREDTIGMLGQEVVEWSKVHHLCKQIKEEPNKAADIVHEIFLGEKGGLESSTN